jgi:hypothetical protein
VDPENKEEFEGKNKGTALNSPDRGMYAMMRYWCRGSIVKALDIVMALITCCGLEQEVMDKLDQRGTNSTNAYIVMRLRSAIQILKQCGSEMINGTRFDEGDIAISVRWLERASEDSQQRTFELQDNGEDGLSVVNSTELRYINIEMEQVAPVGAPPRRSNRSGVLRANPTRPIKFVLPVESEQIILQDCW